MANGSSSAVNGNKGTGKGSQPSAVAGVTPPTATPKPKVSKPKKAKTPAQEAKAAPRFEGMQDFPNMYTRFWEGWHKHRNLAIT